MTRALLATLLLAASAAVQAPAPPVAARHPHEVTSPNGTRVDDYYWLRDDTRSRPEVLDYLKAENAYYEAMTKPYAALTDRLATEMATRRDVDQSTPPYPWKDYLYFTRYEHGKAYPIYARKRRDGSAEQVLVDVDREAAGKEYYQVGGRSVSPGQGLLAFTEDVNGRRQYLLRFRDIATGKELPDRITGVRPGVVWGADDRTIFYIENDPVTLLSTRVKRHTLGTDSGADSLVYEEKDTTFYLGLDKSGDERYIVITLDATEAGEVRYLPVSDPAATPRVLAPRERGVLYRADHVGNRWVVLTDWHAPNMRVMAADDGAAGDKSSWKELVPHDPKAYIDSFVLFADHLALLEWSEGLLRIRYARWSDLSHWTFVRSDEPAYGMGFSVNAEQSTSLLRYTYSSMGTPQSIYQVDMRSGERTLLKRFDVPGYDPGRYVTERQWATARDGVKVPVSIVYRKGLRRDGTAPLLQYGYGSYGASSDPSFDDTVISLLDRGFVYAIAHIRGGQEMGRAWYDAGRLMNKKNTFNDFVDVTDYLVREKYAAPDEVFADGASAGGLLMGAVANMAGTKYRGIIAEVPYVDAVTTMLDESIPLVSNEFDEWGNPKEKAAYDYMLTYSPYDNVRAQPYPAMLVTTGLYDSQVQYYEPTKWVAKLRATKTDHNPLLFKINMVAGHSGRTGLFERARETAEQYAFMLNLLGVNQ